MAAQQQRRMAAPGLGKLYDPVESARRDPVARCIEGYRLHAVGVAGEVEGALSVSQLPCRHLPVIPRRHAVAPRRVDHYP